MISPGGLLEGRAEIWEIFGWQFGRNDDLINSFWIQLTFIYISLTYIFYQISIPFYPWLFDHIPLQASKNLFFRHVENEIGNSRRGLQIPETLWEDHRTLQPQIFKCKVSTPDFSILEIVFFNPRHFNHEFINFLGLKSPGLNLGVKKLLTKGQ